MNNDRVHRRTIYVGDALNSLLESGRVAGGTVSQRIDRLADRYAAMTHELLPARWQPGDWLTIAEVAGEVDLSKPTDALVIGVRLRQLSKRTGASTEVASLAYRFENLKLPEQLAVLDLAERARHAKIGSIDQMTTWLNQNGVSIG